MASKHKLFVPTRSETKADVTNATARGIIDAETAARQAKMERLRKARLARDAAVGTQSAAPARKAPARKAAARQS